MIKNDYEYSLMIERNTTIRMICGRWSGIFLGCFLLRGILALKQLLPTLVDILHSSLVGDLPENRSRCGKESLESLSARSPRKRWLCLLPREGRRSGSAAGARSGSSRRASRAPAARTRGRCRDGRGRLRAAVRSRRARAEEILAAEQRIAWIRLSNVTRAWWLRVSAWKYEYVQYIILLLL